MHPTKVKLAIIGISALKIIGALIIGACVTIGWHNSVYNFLITVIPNKSGGLFVKIVMSSSSLTLAYFK